MTKICKICFSMECFLAEIFNTNVKNLPLGWSAWYPPSQSGISGILLIFPNFLRSKVLEFGLYRASRSHRALPFSFLFMIYICFFCIVYIFYMSVLAPARLYLLFLTDRGSQAKCRLFTISCIYKCYLTTPTC